MNTKNDAWGKRLYDKLVVSNLFYMAIHYSAIQVFAAQ